MLQGPALVDKRNEVLRCPYCDPPKDFKGNAKLQEHLAKKHADKQQQPAAAAPNGAPSIEGPSSRPATAASAAAAPAADGPKLFDVGSRAGKTPIRLDSAARGLAPKQASLPCPGFYDRKSPKMMLHEFCQSKKRPTPKYKATQGDDGMWSCRVILPDPKGHQEEDIILFLPDKDRAQDEQMAQQRAAVLMLHRVQGDRALERVLPAEFVPLWGRLGDEARERDAKAKERAAREERRKEEEAKRRQREMQRGPQVVVMSEHHRRAVEEALALGSRAAVGEEQQQPLDQEGEALAAQLLALGFQEQDARSAAAASAGAQGDLLSSAVDWLVLHTPEERLPEQYGPGKASGNPLSVVARRSELAGCAPWFVLLAKRLAAMGWDSPDAVKGLKAALPPLGLDATDASADPEQAAASQVLSTALAGLYLNWCHAQGLRPAAQVDEGAAAVGPSEEWGEERTALEAIFAEDFECPLETWASVRVAVDTSSPRLGRLLPKTGSASLSLHVLCSPDG